MPAHNVQEELKNAGVQPRGNVDVAADVLVIPVTHSIVSKTTGSDEELCSLADGVPGQELTIVLVAVGGASGDIILTPATKTGFATILLDDVKATMTLKYIDDTVGWIVIGAAGTAANPLIT
jgi:hypothetical protein